MNHCRDKIKKNISVYVPSFLRNAVVPFRPRLRIVAEQLSPQLELVAVSAVRTVLHSIASWVATNGVLRPPTTHNTHTHHTYLR